MDYKTVELREKTLMGLSARTANSAPDMGAVIGGLWQRFLGERVCDTIPNQTGHSSICLYSDYAADGTYDVTVGYEVTCAQKNPQGCAVKAIPAGKYAEFVIVGDVVEAVQKAWQEIWSMPLARTYTGDFEEYKDEPVSGRSEIHIFIAIK